MKEQVDIASAEVRDRWVCQTSTLENTVCVQCELHHVHNLTLVEQRTKKRHQQQKNPMKLWFTCRWYAPAVMLFQDQ